MSLRCGLLALGCCTLPLWSLHAQVPWLSGCWEARSSGRVVHEMWLPAEGGTMIGAGRTVRGQATREFEFLRIHAAGDTLVYTAQPSGGPPTEFRAIGASDGVVAFENPAHDFPTRIIYRRLGTDSLVARVEGPGPDGAQRGVDTPMTRIRCEG